MALQRAEIPLAITRSTGTVSGGSVPVAVSGASVSVVLRGTGTPANVYPTEVSGTPGPNPLTTGVDGRIDGWLDEGSYDLLISGSGITSYTQPLEIVSGKSIVNIPGDRLVNGSIATAAYGTGSIPTAALAAGAVTPLKIANSVQPVGAIIAWWRPSSAYAPPGQSAGQLPNGWVLCDGSVYTSGNHDFGAISITVPNLINRFIMGANPASTYATAGDGGASGAGVMGLGGANFINISHSHTINDHYHFGTGTVGSFTGNMSAADHLHSVGSLYAADHAHAAGGLFTGTGNRGQSMQLGGSAEAGTFLNHIHGVTGATAASGNLGIGGATGAADRGLVIAGTTSGASDRATSASLSSAQDNRPLWTGLVYLIKIKAI